ncbi:hypothetical protein PGT21_016632 [Puccinia graminis f. sp. tritici]|uniref:Uncharacterized protein n=1 Tax=Puccinia graminis f. sp. tritici TaxID=56615 RepID=A0A5B0LP18_PUCGR|nr:hypothetical protein PGT21_016632 [Puccinia graminis f. sp. tritici]KAA1130507.1 hypothetical protein PGTUg99_013161 [Puccinia graminis f. sp. tritici]
MWSMVKQFSKLALFIGCMIVSCWPEPTVADNEESGDQRSFLPKEDAEGYSSAAPGRDHPNLIFASFAGLLQQWPNTFAYSGHSIIPGVVPRGTLLYHGTNYPVLTPTEGLEWFAFNPEYSYVLHSRRPGQLTLHTYVATRTLRIIYIDGQSASLGRPGFSDSQSVLINGSVPIVPKQPTVRKEGANRGALLLEEAYARARGLCKLGKEWGFEGVVRMNTCFKVMWCDFSQGVKLLGSMNTTDPFDTDHPEESQEPIKSSETRDSSSDSTTEFLHNRTDTINPLVSDGSQQDFQQKIEVSGAKNVSAQIKQDDDEGTKKSENSTKNLMLQLVTRPQSINSPFYLRGAQYYFRAASRQYFWPGEARVILDPSGFVSFYDRIESLSEKRKADGTAVGSRRFHRLDGISSNDVKKIKDRLLGVLARKNAEGWRIESDRLDWRTSANTIVQTYSNPLIELDFLLKRQDMTGIERAVEVRGLTYGMILPYLDFSSWNNTTNNPMSFDEGIKKCTEGFTSGTYDSASDLTDSIEVIIGAIEGTLERLCGTIFGIFSQTIQLALPLDSLISPDPKLESDAESRIVEWRQQIKELMVWLGWSTWGHCDPPCKTNELCLPPLWPNFWLEGFPDFDQFPFCKTVSGKKT